MIKLKFSKGNAKLDKTIYTFSLPAGHSCPSAKDCKSKVVIKDGKRKIKDGKHTTFRCFAASSEVKYPAVYEARKHNFDLLRSLSKPSMTKLINSSLPTKGSLFRVHVSGDFFSQKYFDAWMNVAEQNPNKTFYAYTKSLNYWVKRLGKIPSNFILTASYGGRHDELIAKHSLRYAKVVFSEKEAEIMGLLIDHDDSHAMKPGDNFALLLHGTQAKGTLASVALSKLKKAGKTGYSRRIA